MKALLVLVVVMSMTRLGTTSVIGYASSAAKVKPYQTESIGAWLR